MILDLVSSDIDLWNIDLSDTHLDLFDTDIPSKDLVCLQNVFKTYWPHAYLFDSAFTGSYCVTDQYSRVSSYLMKVLD